MPEQPYEAEGSRAVRTRVYFNVDTGEIVRVHQVVESAEQTLDDDFVEEDMALVERSLRDNSPGPLDYIDVDAPDLPGEGVTRVDLASRRMIR